MHDTSQILAIIIFLLGVPEGAASSAAAGAASASHQSQTPLRLPAFNAIQVNSGHVTLRSAAMQRVTVLAGSLDYTRVSVTSGGVLVIDKCSVKCPRGYRLEVEIQSPSVSRISLANGGWVESVGTFARQADLATRVNHGGTIDVRAIAADRVNAEVEQGGRILTAPRGSLFATVTQGGAITYWGNPRVQESVQHGGVVTRGSAEELTVPLADLGSPVMSRLAPIHPPRRESKKPRH